MKAAKPPQSSDPLGAALHHLELAGALYCRAQLTAPWGIEIPDLPGYLVLAIVSRGHFELDLDGVVHRLETGMALLLTTGRAHTVRSEAGADTASLFDLPVVPVNAHYEMLHTGGGGEEAIVTYAVLRFDEVAGARLMSILPPVLEVNRWNADGKMWLHDTLRLVVREAAEMRPGGDTVVTRLSDVLVIQMIRAWLETAPANEQGWLVALRDPQLGCALAAMHDEPQQPWTVASLAAVAGMSRSSFAARFTQLVGQPALGYLTEWRLQRARLLVLRGALPISVIAARVGYQSEASFGRAFKKRFGTSPGRCRASADNEALQLVPTLAVGS